MAVRGAKPITVRDFLGLQTFAAKKNLAAGWWSAANNVIVSNDGSAACLRSPANFNDALSTTNPVYSAFEYTKNTGNLILFDINIGSIGVSSVRTFSTTGSTNTTVRSNQADARWKRLTINDMAYGVNGSEFVQTNGTNTYLNGISAPSAAPTLSFVAGGSGTLATGVTVSYAYRNSTTGHVGPPSAASASSGASTNPTLRIPVVASTQTGVDGIVLFITEDGGSVRYLYIDANSDPVVNANATGNIDISIALLTNLDALTPETTYNSTPPQNAHFMFLWGDRLCLCDFRGATTRQQIQYNIYENCYFGVPWESWYPLNIINLPSKNDAARSGIETPIGALVLGELDGYLIRGKLTDKVSAPEATVSVTEHIASLNWSIGTKSPYTLATTPFGAVWLDQNKRLQLWDYSGFPVEVGLPIRDQLARIQDTAASRNMAEGVWYQFGDEGGHYVLTASTTGSTNNQLYILTIYRDPETGQMKFACAMSDITAQCIVVASDSTGAKQCYIGLTDRLRKILDMGEAGAGWSTTQTRSFTMPFGTEDGFSYWHSLRFDATDTTGLTVAIENIDGSESRLLEVERDEASTAWFAMIDDYGYRKQLKFTFSATDTTQRIINNVEVRLKPTARLV